MKERIQIITYSGTEKNFKDNNVVLSKYPHLDRWMNLI